MSLGSRIKALFAEEDAPRERPIAQLRKLVSDQESLAIRVARAVPELRTDRHKRDVTLAADGDKAAAQAVRGLLGRLGVPAPPVVSDVPIDSGSTFERLAKMAEEELRLADEFLALASREEDASIRAVLQKAADTHRSNNTEVGVVASMITSFVR